MKILILFLTITSACAYDNHEEIDNLTVDKVLFTLLYRVYPTCKYKIADGKPQTFVNVVNILGTEECIPSMVQLEAELTTYKNELNAELTYRNLLLQYKVAAKQKFDLVRPHYHSAAKKANLPHISNPDAWYRDNCANVNTHEAIGACVNKLTIVEENLTDVLAEIKAQKDAEDLCKNYKQVIKNATLQQFAGLSEAKRWEHVFNALKCISEGK